MIPLVSREGAAGPREPVEQDCSARSEPVIALALSNLPWIAPATSSLAAVCRLSGDPWQAVRYDPGLLVLMLRQPEYGDRLVPLAERVRARLEQPAVFEEALSFLRGRDAGFVEWSTPGPAALYRFCVRLACYASSVAAATSCCAADDAWIAGLLAPLGWLGAAAASPQAVADCLADPAFTADPCGTQQRLWGLDHAALARRLARRWRLPDAILAVSGCLALPLEAAERQGAEPGLFDAVRQAVALLRRDGSDLGLDGVPVHPNGIPIQLDEPAALPAGNPYTQPWLCDLLALTAENRHLRDNAGRDRQERSVDLLYDSMRQQLRDETERLRQSKVEAMAEFAAGAGHEINNPLAVISGQAQYLLGHEADWFREDAGGQARHALHAIIAQTRRIHGLLRDLMLYARPAPPRPTRADLPTLLGEVAASFADQAAQRQVRIELVPGPDRLPVFVDAEQVKTALGCLVRNALEAAAPNGWIRLGLAESAADDLLDITIEDSGPGPEPAQVQALFDPLYSGRSAGRGKGLGLPIAWRLARQHGGDVRLDRVPPAGPTRFAFRLARAVPVEMSEDILAPEAHGLAASLPLCNRVAS